MISVSKSKILSLSRDSPPGTLQLNLGWSVARRGASRQRAIVQHRRDALVLAGVVEGDRIAVCDGVEEDSEDEWKSQHFQSKSTAGRGRKVCDGLSFALSDHQAPDSPATGIASLIAIERKLFLVSITADDLLDGRGRSVRCKGQVGECLRSAGEERQVRHRNRKQPRGFLAWMRGD